MTTKRSLLDRRIITQAATALVLLAAFACKPKTPPLVTGEMKLWHPVSITFEGPESSEDGDPNPFRNYRLDVTFRHSGSGASYTVPGYFAADGNAAETSAKSGNKWRAHFTPDHEGNWEFNASFRTGTDVAISDDASAGEPSGFDGATGNFTIGPPDEAGSDARAKGLLRYVGGHYLQYAGNQEYFLKGGADSPENFLGYGDFDDTFDTGARFNEGENKEGEFVHHYAPHEQDWKEGDPTWQNGKGKSIIGALNYLASKGMNSVYFLTYNIDGGDGKDVWMWSTPDVRDRYDCSKLDQWEIVFSHMDARGIQLHVVTQETENDTKLGGSGGLNPERRLYYRELVARFGHHLAVEWNQGEENNVGDDDRKAIAKHIRSIDAYQRPITVHTKNNRAPDFYNGLLGDPNFEVTSIQGRMEDYNSNAIVLRQRSAEAGRKWAIFGDEQPAANTGIMPDENDPEHDIPRTQALWGNLMGGGSGVEWYFGYNYPNMDLNCEDWRSREIMWDQTRYAIEFFHKNLPFWEMEPDNDLVAKAPGGKVLAKAGEVYAVYLPAMPKEAVAQLTVPEGEYGVQWYNPRTGGELAQGSVVTISGPGAKALGRPPADANRDWAVLVKRN